MSNIRIPANLDERDVEEIIEYSISAMEGTKDRLEQDVAEICSAARYSNRAADDFFQIVVNVFAYGAEQANHKNVDPFAERAFSKLVDSGLEMAFACAILDDRALSRDCSRNEIDDFEAIKDDYDVILRSIGGGRGGRSRGGRSGRDRDDDRDSRDRDRGRDRGSRSSSSSRGGSSRRRKEGGANNQPTAYRTREREEEVEERPRGRASRREVAPSNVYNISDLQRMKALEPNHETGAGHVYNPSTSVINAIENNGHFVEVLQAVEDYSKHELKRSLLTHDNERRIVPLVSFKDTSDDLVAERADPVEIYIEPSVVRIDYPLVNFEPTLIAAATYPILIKHRSKIVLMQAVLHAKFTMPEELAGVIGNMAEFNTFEGWYRMLVALRNFALEPTTTEETSLHVMTEINRLDQMLANLFNNYMTMLCYPKVKLTSFLQSWPDALKWLKHDDQADLSDEFTELETKLFDANMKITLPAPTLVDNEDETAHVTTPTFYIDRAIVLVQYAGSIVGDEVDFSRIGEPCTITFDDTPDFYTSCNRLAKRRSGRFAMADIYMTDSLGRLIVIGARENNSGSLRATMYR